MGKLVGVSIFTLGVLFSFVFFIVTLLLLYFRSFDISIAIAVTLGINIVLFLIGPWFTDFLIRHFYKAAFYSKEEIQAMHPTVYALIDRISQEYSFAFPKFAVIADGNPTAFSYGTGRYNARIVVTEGIFKFLNDEEQQSVVAHEMGHVVNRDFLVMMVASTLVQVLYEIYAVFIRARGKKTGSLKLLALASYVLYVVGSYMLLFLSRTREYMADSFSAEKTSPVALTNALIKIAYGIVAVEDTNQSKRLLESTRHLGIVDVKNAKHVGLVSYITNHDPNVLSEVFVFDKVNPWAKWIELSSTHPLTGNRVDALHKIAVARGIPFPIDVAGAVARLHVSMIRLWGTFLLDFSVSTVPWIGLLLGFFIGRPVDALLGLGIGILVTLIYRFPLGTIKATTILDEMRNPYASPMRGYEIELKGQVIGKGTPGYVFSEDMMYQDATGMTFLDYSSAFGFIGNFLFAITKIKTLIGQPSTAVGWFTREMSSKVALQYVKTQDQTIRSHPVLWSALGGIFLIVLWFVLSSFALG